ncbi:uncharacterized protein [Argopecten irradians]|uniref:uncharacterized protein n=1 Tax=Argopecten irradians TaxID=31199 RepID=UPI00371DDA46
MVLPTTLKKRHSLKTLSLMPAIRRLKDDQAVGAIKEFARIVAVRKTEELSLRDVTKYIMDLTGEPLSELLQMAGKEEDDVEAARALLHFCILLANEKGQPTGQVLRDSAQSSSAVRESGGPCELTEELTISHDQGPTAAKKAKSELERRLVELEKATKEDDPVKTLKERVRTLALQQDPIDSLILLNLDDLAKTARRTNHNEVELFEEFFRQAYCHRQKLNIPSLCLNVLGGKSADIITRAISRCMREKEEKSDDLKKESKGKECSDQTGLSPLSNLYPPTVPFAHMPMGNIQFPTQSTFPFFTPGFQNMPANSTFRGGYNSGGYSRPYRGEARNWRPKGTCLFCDATGHHVRDCDKMKLARKK